jgi:hypothetical protein
VRCQRYHVAEQARQEDGHDQCKFTNVSFSLLPDLAPLEALSTACGSYKNWTYLFLEVFTLFEALCKVFVGCVSLSHDYTMEAFRLPQQAIHKPTVAGDYKHLSSAQ